MCNFFKARFVHAKQTLNNPSFLMPLVQFEVTKKETANTDDFCSRGLMHAEPSRYINKIEYVQVQFLHF
jgi:hypothetical protein